MRKNLLTSDLPRNLPLYMFLHLQPILYSEFVVLTGGDGLGRVLFLHRRSVKRTEIWVEAYTAKKGVRE